MGRQGRAADAAAAGRPSVVARDRLAARVRAEVADVRVRLEEATLRSDALLATGQPERAAAVLDEQHALLAELQDNLASAVASASVEAEAESVLSGCADGAALFGTPRPDPASPRGGVRPTASSLASAVAVLALLVVALPTPSPESLSVTDPRTAPGREDAADPVEQLLPGAPDGDRDVVPEERTIGPRELEVRRLLRSPRELPPRGDVSPGLDIGLSGLGLSNLQSLVDQVVATVVRAAGELLPESAPTEDRTDLDRRRPRPDTRQDEGQPRSVVAVPVGEQDAFPAPAPEQDRTGTDGDTETDGDAGTTAGTDIAADDGREPLTVPDATSGGSDGLPSA